MAVDVERGRSLRDGGERPAGCPRRERLGGDVVEVGFEGRPQRRRVGRELEFDPGGEVEVERLPLRLHGMHDLPDEPLRHELRHLQAQISPHFLFNALNTLQACRQDPEAIATLTQALAAYLRFLLEPAAVLEPLSRELDALEEYFTIQEVRFGDGLETRIDCDFAARGLLVPPLLVQPLVENAIKYGGQTAPLPIRVHVGVRLTGDWLEVEVANTGRWVAPGGATSTGTGLPSLERRLQLLLGPTSSVSHREEDGWVRVLIRIPAPPAPANAFPGDAT